MRTPEAKVKAQVKLLLDALGCVYVMPIGSGYGKSNTLDFCVAVPVRDSHALHLEIETKADASKKLTKLQEARVAELLRVNALYMRIDGDNYEEQKGELASLMGYTLEEVEAKLHVLRVSKLAKKQSNASRRTYRQGQPD